MLRTAIVVALLAACSGAWQWVGSEAGTLESVALSKTKDYRVFNPDGDGPVIYALDGQSYRNGVAAAVFLSSMALLRGDPLPKIVAIHSDDERDLDFRNRISTPTYWRPTIEGRAQEFDLFLLNELFPTVEGGSPSPSERYLMGHSLAGLYSLDFGTRHPDAIAGIFAFAPTFSHDTSIVERLPKLCGQSIDIYVNWGLESARDTAIFDQTVAQMTATPNCIEPTIQTSRHHGSLHQTIMLTGQVHISLSRAF